MMASSSKRSAVLSIGRIYSDLIFTGLAGLPVLGREVFANDLAISAGGGAFITAAHLRHIGRDASLVARLGTDPLSVQAGAEILATGVDLRFIERAADAGPQVTAATVLGEERAFLTKRAGPARPSTLRAALEWSQAQHLHIAEYATLHEIPNLVDLAKARGLTVSLDPSWDADLIYDKSLLPSCRGVDVFLPNREEAEAITGHADPADALAHLVPFFPHVVLKDGANGAWLATGGEILHVPSQPVTVIDTTGAGDAFNAGFIDAWLRSETAKACLDAGIVAGSFAVQSAGGASAIHENLVSAAISA